MRRVQVAFIELQPDLQNPQAPLLLGTVVIGSRGAGGVAWGAAGRVAKPDRTPTELLDAPPLVTKMAARWPTMLRSALEGHDTVNEALEALQARFRWNLYVTEIQVRVIDRHVRLADVAEKLYEARSEKRNEKAARRHGRGVPAGTPDAWMIASATPMMSVDA